MKPTSGIAGFRIRLLLGMMLVVSAVTALTLWIAQHRVSTDVRQQMQQAFLNETTALQQAREVRHAALVERSRVLARRPRIHAALEDDARDLLYPNAEDALRDTMDKDANHALKARFYRFLDAHGKVIPAPPAAPAGRLSPAEEAALSLPELPRTQQVGYLARDGALDEIIAAPIISTESEEVIANILLGFRPFDVEGGNKNMRAGIWTAGSMFMDGCPPETLALLSRVMSRGDGRFPVEIDIQGTPHLVFSQLLNPDSVFPPAHEVCVYSLDAVEQRRKSLRLQILGAGGLLLLGAGTASHIIAGRLAMPVTQLAADSARNAVRREQAEAALELTNVELERSMRFSADTSHQLKTPITVLRAGLEELGKHPGVTPAMHGEIGQLIQQTSKLSVMIHDLLLLSRLDAGRLQPRMESIDMGLLVDSLADDLSAVPGATDLEVIVDVPPDLHVRGEKRYVSMILQNLLENAWKYNTPGGSIHIRGERSGELLALRVGNTGPPIPAPMQEHIFERFHRAAMGENVPGHGLGLNIARELALLHGGDLRLLSSENSWTEFEITLPISNDIHRA